MSRMRGISKLAASIVATVGLLPACNKSGEPPRDPHGCEPPDCHMNPPPPDPKQHTPPPVDPKSHVFKGEDGKCYFEPEVNCPPPDEATCNPPAPRPIECPADMK